MESLSIGLKWAATVVQPRFWDIMGQGRQSSKTIASLLITHRPHRVGLQHTTMSSCGMVHSSGVHRAVYKIKAFSRLLGRGSQLLWIFALLSISLH